LIEQVSHAMLFQSDLVVACLRIATFVMTVGRLFGRFVDLDGTLHCQTLVKFVNYKFQGARSGEREV
jgi:uncharacterized membrane protein